MDKLNFLQAVYGRRHVRADLVITDRQSVIYYYVRDLDGLPWIYHSSEPRPRTSMYTAADNVAVRFETDVAPSAHFDTVPTRSVDLPLWDGARSDESDSWGAW